uniref:Uncharacterized protein n=1 Tax=Anopheles coluzzii TaxID=1518534 RepID=A0A8W7P1M9_ANOCL
MSRKSYIAIHVPTVGGDAFVTYLLSGNFVFLRYSAISATGGRRVGFTRISESVMVMNMSTFTFCASACLIGAASDTFVLGNIKPTQCLSASSHVMVGSNATGARVCSSSVNATTVTAFSRLKMQNASITLAWKQVTASLRNICSRSPQTGDYYRSHHALHWA